MVKFCPDYHFMRSDSVFPVSIRELRFFKILYITIVNQRNILKRNGERYAQCLPFLTVTWPDVGQRSRSVVFIVLK